MFKAYLCLTKFFRMRRLLISLMFVLSSLLVYAPETTEVIWPELGYTTTEVNSLDRLWLATCYVESRFNEYAIKEDEGAYGIAQIRQIRLDDYYQKTGVYYTLTDCFKVEVAKEIWYYYAENVHAGFDYCTIARSWNGSGPMTWEYWDKIEEALKIVS